MEFEKIGGTFEENLEYLSNVSFSNTFFYLVITRKYPLRGYILGVLAHTTALERLWGDDETLTMWF